MNASKNSTKAAKVNSGKRGGEKRSLWNDGGLRPKKRIRGLRFARATDRHGEAVYRVTDATQGKRRTHERRTRAEAVALYEELAARLGTPEGMLALTPSEIAALLTWRAWKAQRVLEGKEPPSLDAMLRRSMEEAEAEAAEGLPLDEAFSQYVDALRRAGRVQKYISRTNVVLRRFLAALPAGSTLNSVTAKTAVDALRAVFHGVDGGLLAPRTQKYVASAASGCWKHFIALGEATENPWPVAFKRIGIAEPPLRLRPRKEYTDPDSLRRMLSYTLEHRPAMLPCLAIIAFCGLRPTEAFRMTWSHVLLEGDETAVIVGEGATKTDAAARKVRLCAAGVAWIKAGIAKTGEPARSSFIVRGGTEHSRGRLWDELLKAFRENCPPALLPAGVAMTAWPRDLLRHSFGTYYRAATDSLAATAEAMGNTIAVCKAHYSRPVTKAEGEAWFSVAP